MFRWLSFLILGGLALGISILIIPSEEELALLHVNDKEFSTAVMLYEEELEEEMEDEDPKQRTIFPLVALHLQKGETDKVIKLLQSLIKDEPDNLQAYKLLAKVYKDTQNTHAYIKTIEKIHEMEANPELLKEMEGYYKFIQNKEKEIDKLALLVEIESATKEQIQRLTKFYVAEKKWEKAVSSAMKLLPKMGETKYYDDLYFVFTLLKKTDNLLKLKYIAQDYISSTHAKSSVEVIDYISHYIDRDLARKLARPLIRKIPFNPHIIQWRVDDHVRHKEPEKAFEVLNTLASKRQLPAKFEETFVALATSLKDPKGLGKALRFVDLKALSHRSLMGLAEHILYKKLAPEAKYIRLKLGEAFLKKAPLLKALLAAADRKKVRAVGQQDFSALQDVPRQERLKLAQAFHAADSNDMAKALLEQDFSLTKVPDKNLISVCETLIHLGLAQKSLVVLLRAYPNMSRQNLIKQQAWALLATASKLEDQVIRWVKRMPPKSEGYLKTLYDLSSQHKLFQLTEILAEQLYKLNSTESGKIRLAEAYLNTKSYAKAEPYLKDLAYDKGGAWEHDYVAVLKKLKKTQVLNTYWKQKVEQDGVDQKNKRQIGYLLLANGDKLGAEKIFYELAENQGPKHPDVEQLLSIWGQKIKGKAFKWIKVRAQKAPLRQKKAWLKKLLYGGHPQAVIDIINAQKLASNPKLTSVYLEALEKTHDRQGMQSVLFAEIEQKNDVTVLTKLVDLAWFSGNQTLVKKAIKKLAKLAPNHPKVLKATAEYAMAQKNYSKAMKALQKLLALGKEDVRSLYNYAEILRKRQSPEKAKTYYKRTLEKIKHSKMKGLEYQVIEAKSLYFIGKKLDSISKNRKILAAHRNNKTLRADIAHFYMDVGELKEAEVVLNG